MTIKSDLITRARNIAAELAALDATKLGGLPNVAQAEGGTAIDHVGYKKALWDELRQIFDLLGVKSLAELDALEDGEQTAFEIETQLEL